MSKIYFTFIDVEGRPFTVEQLAFYEQLRLHSFKLFGMDLPCLLEMRKQYLLRCGPMDITVESIREAFGR